jgi:hypothetical protein
MIFTLVGWLFLGRLGGAGEGLLQLLYAPLLTGHNAGQLGYQHGEN